MGIVLHGEIGFIIFMFILIIFEGFSGVIGYLLANALGLTGMLWWFFVAGVVVIMNLIFLNVN